MSLEEEDNSPLGESNYVEDEFTDLPLSQGEEEEGQGGHEGRENSSSGPDKSESSETARSTAVSKEIEPDESTISAPLGTHASGTVAYNPELYSSTIQHSFKDEAAVSIEIVDAGKSHEGQSRGYIVYTIKCNDSIVRRRYSEFESLRKSLVRLNPTTIIPPIPEKHAIAKYAAAPTKAKEDAAIIDHRRRMLGVFLKRCLSIDKVRESEVFQKFLDPNANWSEVLASPPLSNIPKNILQSDPLDPANSSAAHSYLPIPTTSTLPARSTPSDVKFNKIENGAREYESVIANGLEKVTKRLIKHLTDLSIEFSEAGVAFNAFSLEETGKLASILEKLGQAHDNSFVSTESLVQSLTYDFAEPLGESVQFASVVKDVLKFRQQKSLQYDISARSLKHKHAQLRLLERSEEESKRIEQVIRDGQAKTGQINFDRKVAAKRQQEQDSPQSGETIPLEPKRSSTFKIPGISRITNIIKETIESDSGAHREQNLIKAKEDLNQLNQTFSAAESDLKAVVDSLIVELDRFQKTREKDQKKMMLAYSRCIVDWSRKNLEFWEDTKARLEDN